MNIWDYIVIGIAMIFAIASTTTAGFYTNAAELIGGIVGSFIIFWIIGAGILYVIRWFKNRKTQ
jgi:hypothetical protein